MAAVKHNYSLWFVPQPGPLRDQLQATISALSDRYPTAARSFAPHVTLIGAVQCTEEEIRERTRAIASHHAPFPIEFEKVAQGSIYFQTVFLLAKKTPPLMAIGAEARDVFHWPPAYMPHLSLIYNDMTEAQRAQLVEEQAARHGDLSGLSFSVGEVQIWLTNPDDKSTASWTLVDSVPLKGPAVAH